MSDNLIQNESQLRRIGFDNWFAFQRIVESRFPISVVGMLCEARVSDYSPVVKLIARNTAPGANGITPLANDVQISSALFRNASDFVLAADLVVTLANDLMNDLSRRIASEQFERAKGL